ncbi:MAG: vitamin K epoxide reductase family protein [Desulfobacterales bacterium]|jgi:uncharacterized membrane protein/protein-disulfide isomerase
MENAKKNKSALPFGVYYWTVAFLAAAGLADSIYLAISHYRVYTDITYSSFCAISKAINCDTISQSPYSIFAGLPVPAWGVAGYLCFLLLLTFAKTSQADKKRMWSLLYLIAWAFSLCSLFLAYISTAWIRSYCIMCIVSYAINFLLLFYTRMIRIRFDSGPLIKGLAADLSFLGRRKVSAGAILSCLLAVLILARVFYPTYWHLDEPVPATPINSGLTPEGHPWIGADNPRLVITEYTDYQCFQCKKMHYFLRQLIAQHPDKIRLVHRHFPMDHEFNPIVKDPFHVGSGKMALLAIYATAKDQFWPMNDLLFKIARDKQTIDVREIAQEVGIDYRELAWALNNKNIRYRLKHDIAQGLQAKIDGTPAFFIDGTVHLGQIPPAIIKKALH